MYELVCDIVVTLESDKVPMGLFLDLSIAFDSVNHARLLKKPSFYGIRDYSKAICSIEFKVFASIMEDRFLCLRITMST